MNHTVTVGTIRVTSLEIATQERTLEQISEIFPDMPEDQLGPAVDAAYGKRIEWSFNAALIRTEDATILVDTGFVFSDGGPGASTASLLKEAGVGPSDVDLVVITHGHGDHVGGLVNDGNPSFPNAELIVSSDEYHHWMKAGSGGAVDGFAAYQTRLRLIAPDELISGRPDGDRISAIDAPGHTPGHIGLDVVSGGKRLWLLVDSAHALVQLAHPEWSPRYDTNPITAAATRKTLLGAAADGSIPVLMYHFPFPGFGRILREGQGFRFDPFSSI